MKTESNGLYTYKQLSKFNFLSEAENKRKVFWTGVECKGDFDNNSSIFFKGEEFAICSLCKNQIQCTFNTHSANNFEMKEEFSDLKIEPLNDWVHKNKNTLRIKPKNIF